MKLSIRTKLLLGFLTILSLSSIVQIVVLIIVEKNITQEHATLHEQKSKEAAKEIADFFSNIEISSISFSDFFTKLHEEPSTRNEHQLDAALSYALEVNSSIESISVVMPSGEEIVKFDRVGKISQEKLGTIEKSDYVRNAASGNTTISRVYYLQEGTDPYIDIFVPIYQKGKTIALVAAHINLVQLWSFISTIRLGDTGFAYVVDSDGVIIAHPNKQLTETRKGVGERAFIVPLLNRSTRLPTPEDYFYTNENNIRVLARSTFVPLLAGTINLLPTGWLVVFEQSRNEAFAFINFMRALLIATFGGSVLLLLVIALSMSHNLTYLITVLRIATEDFQKGKFGTRVFIKSGDEIEHLANSFNTMASRIEHSITELQDDRAAIATERNKLSVALMGINDGVLGLDLNQRVMITNSAFGKIVDLSEAEIVGKSIGEIISVYDKDKEITPKEYCPQVVEGFEGISFIAQGLRVKTKKREAFVNITTGHIKEAKSAGVGCILMVHNVTEERRLEQLKGDFVAIVAHKLRTPLSAVKWAMRMFLDEEVGKVTKEQKNLLQKVYASNERMISLVNTMLNVAKFEGGKYAYTGTVIDIQKLIESAVAAEKLETKKRGVKVVVKKPSVPLPKVSVDVETIKIVIQSIVNNAFRYTLPGGSVTISATRKKDAIVVSVADTGIGIPKGQEDKLLEKFFRADNAMHVYTEGFGLGLFMAKKIVEDHGGELWFQSQEGKGSTFYFSLPFKTRINVAH